MDLKIMDIDISLKTIFILLILVRCIAVIISFFFIGYLKELDNLLMLCLVLVQAMFIIPISESVHIYAFLLLLIIILTDILIFLKFGLIHLLIVGGVAQIYFILFHL